MIPIATTAIDVLRVPDDPTRDPTDEQPAEQKVASGVRAVISAIPGASNEATRQAASQELVRFKLTADPCEIEHTDRVRDRSGQLYEVLWARRVAGIYNQDHVEGELRQVTGVAG